MSAPHLPKVAGIDPVVTAPPHTAAPTPARTTPAPAPAPGGPGSVIQDRLAGMVSDLTTLHELTERLARTSDLDSSLREFLRAGAALVGARRGLVVLEPSDGLGPSSTIGLGLGHAELGHIETVPRSATSYGRILDGLPDAQGGSEFLPEPGAPPGSGGFDAPVDPRHREVAARLGYAASYSPPHRRGHRPARRGRLALRRAGGAERPPARPRRAVRAPRRRTPGPDAGGGALPLAPGHRLRGAAAEPAPRIPGVQLAARHHTGPLGGGDWYDALPLPEGALGLAVGSVTGSGPSAVAAMGRLRASLRAYAVMEGEDPVAVLSDLELLLRLTEPARSATALFAYCEPAGGAQGQGNKIILAGAGHTPPLLIGEHRTEYVETSLSAPWACCPAGRRRAWRSNPHPEKRCFSTPTGCCTTRATRWTAPTPGCTPPPRGPPQRPRGPGGPVRAHPEDRAARRAAVRRPRGHRAARGPVRMRPGAGSES